VNGWLAVLVAYVVLSPLVAVAVGKWLRASRKAHEQQGRQRRDEKEIA
jgi:hypothetical protein